MRPRPTPERIAEIRDWVTQTVPDGVQEAHLEMAQDLLTELDSRRLSRLLGPVGPAVRS